MNRNILFLPNPVTAHPQVEQLLDLCFGPSRHARTAALLRQGATRIDHASFLAVDQDEVLGSVECWELQWRQRRRTLRMGMLGPLAIHPDHRGRGIGTQLMDLALTELDRLQLPVMLIGDEPYYGRWGFSSQHTGGWAMPGPVESNRLLLRADKPQRFAGPALLGQSVIGQATTRSAA